MAKKMEVKEIREVDIMSLAKLLALIQGAIGLAIGLLFSLFALPFRMISGSMFPFFFGFGSIIILPVMYAIFGFLIGLVTGFLYNFFAERFGGIKLKLR